MLRQGGRLTDAHAAIARRSERPAARAADERPAGQHPGDGPRPVVAVPGVHDPGPAAPGPIDDVEFRGAASALGRRRRSHDAIAAARAIVIGPSNPVISIGPILAVPGMRDALTDSPAPVVAVSPIVGGAVLKRPTVPFMALGGPAAVQRRDRRHYGDLIDGLVADERAHDASGARDRRADGRRRPPGAGSPRRRSGSRSPSGIAPASQQTTTLGTVPAPWRPSRSSRSRASPTPSSGCDRS